MPRSQITVRLDRKRLDRAKRALGAKTATEAIEQALALATEKAAHDAVVRKYGGVGKRNSFVGR